MNSERSDGERALREWFHDGPTVMPDRVIDVIANRIAREPQRSRWRFRGRPFMTTPTKLAAGLAAVLLVAVLGYTLLPRQPGPGGDPSPPPSPEPTTVATEPVIDLPDGPLDAGRYRIRPLPDDPDLGDLELVADIPAGWQGHRDIPALVSPGADNNDGVLIGFMKADTLFSDPCHWDLDGSGDRGQPGDVAVEPERFRLGDALRANPAYTYGGSEPWTLDGFPALDMKLELPGSDVLASCDSSPDSGASGGDFLVFGGGFWAQGPDNHWRLTIIEVDGSLLVTMVSSFGETPIIEVEAGQAIVESFEITP